MRLSAQQVAATESDTVQIFGTEAGVRLSGSCAADKQRGFTLVELVVIIVIVGILAVAAVPRMFDSQVFESYGAADQVRAALRYGQKVAIAQRANVSVVISSAAASDCGAVLAGGNVNCVISNSVTVPNKTVTFNGLGQRVPNVADSITVGTGGNARTINIEAETGYVH